MSDVLQKLDWSFSVLIEGSFHFGDAVLTVSQAQIAPIMSFVNENVCYNSYFPTDAVREPPVAQVPAFATGFDVSEEAAASGSTMSLVVPW